MPFGLENIDAGRISRDTMRGVRRRDFAPPTPPEPTYDERQALDIIRDEAESLERLTATDPEIRAAVRTFGMYYLGERLPNPLKELEASDNPERRQELAREAAEDIYDQGFFNTVVGAIAPEYATNGRQVLIERANEMLREMDESPGKWQGKVSPEARATIWRQLQEAKTPDARKQQKEIAEARDLLYSETMKDAGFFEGLGVGFGTMLASSERQAERIGAVLTAPVGGVGGVGVRAAGKAFLQGAAIEGAISLPDELRIGYRRQLQAAALDRGDEYQSEQAWETVKNIGYNALFGGVLGGGIKVGHTTINSIRNYRATSGLPPTRPATTAPPAGSIRPQKIAVAKGKPKSVGGGKIYKGGTRKDGEIIEVNNPVRLLNDDFKATTKKGTGEAIVRRFAEQGHGGAVNRETGEVFVFPPKEEPAPTPQTQPAATQAGGEFDAEFENTLVKAREFSDAVPVARVAGSEIQPLVAAKKGAKGAFSIGGSRYANELSEEGKQALEMAQEAYSVQQDSGINTPKPEEIFAVQDGALVFRNDVPDTLVNAYTVGYATEIPAPRRENGESPLRSMLDGTSVRDIQNRTPQGETEKVVRQAEEEIDNAFGDLEGDIDAPKYTEDMQAVANEFGDTVARYGLSISKKNRRLYIGMLTAIKKAKQPLDSSAQTADMLIFAFRKGTTTQKRADIYAKLQEVAKLVPDVLLRTTEQKQMATTGGVDLLDNILESGYKMVDVGGNKLIAGKRADGSDAVRANVRLLERDGLLLVQRNSTVYDGGDPAAYIAKAGDNWQTIGEFQSWADGSLFAAKTPTLTKIEPKGVDELRHGSLVLLKKDGGGYTLWNGSKWIRDYTEEEFGDAVTRFQRIKNPGSVDADNAVNRMKYCITGGK